MRIFILHVIDTRYAAPRIVFILVMDEGRARERARRILDESEHHSAVEVWCRRQPLFNVTAHGWTVMS